MFPATLKKDERICNFRLIEQIFNGKTSHSFAAFPLRAVFLPVEDGNKILISVPKRHFKHAVDRNRIKRQVREAYRKNKNILANKSIAIAFIWMSGRMLTSEEVTTRVVSLLNKINKIAV
ncbi:MAG: ribonuclease P protein component [Prevotellaceae bacterium]|nr:ribonuclease P protein component [Prevotellaceae bacterium]